MENFEQIIIGAGAAGLFAAAHSIQKTLILEKKSSAGNKLLISGQGRCNYTHSGPVSDFFSHYGKAESIIKHALKSYTNQNVIDFFKNLGLQYVEDKNGKLFPASGNAGDILDLLLGQIIRKKHVIRFNEPVLRVSFIDGFYHVFTKTGEYLALKLIIATGGKSYPKTGSTGDGYNFARQCGHSIVEPVPSLSPVFVKDYPFADLAGISLKDCQLSLYRNNKKIETHKGDIGFTHKGLSGPGILDFSRYIRSGDIVELNLIGLNDDKFNQLFLDEVKTNGKMTVQGIIRPFEIPKSLLKSLLQSLKLNTDDKISTITKEKRKELVQCMCHLRFDIERVGGFNVAMCTSGGVALSEINPKTMESKVQKGLYFAGEVLDIDGDTGGYNLQAAFSTGYLAAKGN